MIGDGLQITTTIHQIVIYELIQQCHSMAVEKGFWDSNNAGEKIALMHSELSEMLEAIRHGDPKDEHCPEFNNSVIELADLIIRAFDFAGYFKMPLADAIVAKMDYNSTRPYKHGKKF